MAHHTLTQQLRGPQRPQFYNANKKDATDKVYKGMTLDEVRKQDYYCIEAGSEYQERDIDTEILCNEFSNLIQYCVTAEDVLAEKLKITKKITIQVDSSTKKESHFKTIISTLKEIDKIAEAKIAELTNISNPPSGIVI